MRIRYNCLIMRKLIYALVILLAVILIIAQFAEVRAIMDTLQRGDWRFIFLAFGVQLLWLVNVALSNQVIFRATGISEKLSKLVQLSAAANFLTVVAPSVGMSGMAVFIAEARRRGYSTGRVTVVEGVLTLVLRSMNVSLSDAVVVTLAYRGITLWIPLLYGFLAFRFLSRRTGSVEAVQA